MKMLKMLTVKLKMLWIATASLSRWPERSSTFWWTSFTDMM